MPQNKALVRAAKPKDELMVLGKQEQLELLKQTYAKGASDTEFKMLFAIGNKVGADPFRKEIYLVPFWDNDAKRMARTPVVGIDWYRKQAGKSANYAGQGETEFGEDESTNGCVHPAWAVTPVFNHKFTQPVRVKVFWKEVAKLTKEGVAMSNWKSMPHTMLAKCSEAQGIRKAFPEEVGGVYIEEEMATNGMVAVEGTEIKTNIQAAAPVEKVDPEKIAYLEDLISQSGKLVKQFLAYLKKDKMEDLTAVEIDSWINKFEVEIDAALEKQKKTNPTVEVKQEFVEETIIETPEATADPIAEALEYTPIPEEEKPEEPNQLEKILDAFPGSEVIGDKPVAAKTESKGMATLRATRDRIAANKK
jgi:phage recombination protein Bet